jgi:hypothetical protein
MTSVRRRIAAMARTLACALSLTAGMAACAFAQDGPYPARVADFGQFDHFPATVGPYKRGDVVAFAPRMSDFSIAYDSRAPDLDSAVTLYFYPRRFEVARQMHAEEDGVLQVHPGARVVARRAISIKHGDATSEAVLETFEYEGKFSGESQPLTSQLLMVFRDRSLFKVRSTAPALQGAQAELAMLALVQAIDWDSVPDR